MEITDVIVHTLSLSNVEDVANGTQDAAIIEVTTDEGITGIGEADSSPAVVEAIVNAPRSHDKSTGLKEVVVGRDPFDVQVLWDEMFDKSYYYGRKGAAITAISGIDMALWDIMGKVTGKPIHKLIGGKKCNEVRAYASTLFPEDPMNTEYMRRQSEQILEDGFTAVKFGWGSFGQDVEHDHELLGAARDILGPNFDIMVDAGMTYGWDTKRAIKTTKSLDKAHNLFWMEEPVFADNVEGYAEISNATETRIVGGEEEYTAYGFRDFISRGNVDGVQPDVARSGGITHMNKIASLAAQSGIPFLPHGYSTDILVAASLHLIAANPNAPLLEYCIEDSPLRWDVVEEDLDVEDGYVSVPTDPGLGVTLDRDTIAKYRTKLLC
ncbi:mandelate racemase/muconate lactonizing enzyme family protein [Halorubrum trueperi]|uniref:Mandelate racemase/muconate lactonizing enzyme family protein n=1 Tax=Halorubrum trueperi TaxID=2004704 RepID=A0ABD5UKT0_9EURY